ncbi:hypothetical protein ECPA39_5030, partial [Escherichia coli PA39]
MFYHIKF